MCLEPKDKLLAALFRGRSREAGEEPDLNRIVELASGKLSPEEAGKWQEILSLDPELRADLLALREETGQGAPGGGKPGENDALMLRAVAGARWRGALRIGYTKEGLFRVADPGGTLRFPRWVDRVFAVGKRMLSSQEVGIWPTHEVTFDWPGEEPLLQASVAVRHEAPVLGLRRSGSGSHEKSTREVDLEYWRGGQWVGAATLWEEEPRLVIHLKPEWPYLVAVRGDDPVVLRVAGHRVEFSPLELRVAALLRVLAGDVSGGFELVRSRLLPVPRVFRWTLGLLSRCLPKEAIETGYAAVRDAATQEEIRSGLKELFDALAAGWLEASGGITEEEEMERALEEKRGPVAQGFRLALRGAYEEAATFWEASAEETPSEPHVAAALYLARRLSAAPELPGESARPLPEEIQKVMRCARALAEGTEQTEESVSRLAEGLGAVCREGLNQSG